MVKENNFQGKVVRWLKQKGCYVMVVTTTPGIPAGCPDIIALVNGGGWIALECKKGPREKFQPLQKATIAKLDGMYFSRAVYPENWLEVQKELLTII